MDADIILRKIKHNYVIFILLILLLLNLVSVNAQNIQVSKEVPKEIQLGEILNVKIIIKNLVNKKIELKVRELASDADPIDPQKYQQPVTPSGCKYCLEPPYYSWNITLNPLETETINYKIKPITPGNFSLSPTVVTTSDGEVFYSNSTVTFIKCKPNNICEPNLGENYITCPEDCRSGSKDNVCNSIKDGMCDLDCEQNADPDCVTTTTEITTTTIQSCNKNKKCEPSLGENYRTCPQDCPSGSKDDYCDRIHDGICDPDCTQNEDSDCKESIILWVYILVVVAIIILLVLFLIRKGR